jgi:predicted DNA-binding antitoxin AbrB/MazE fold protein
MSHEIPAIYDHGVLHPLEPLALADGTRVSLRISDVKEAGPTADPASVEEIARRKAALADFQRLMAELPLEGPADGFSGADHDRPLYGKP